LFHRNNGEANTNSGGYAVRTRRLALRYERRADVHETFLTLGCALITWRYLKREI